MSDGRRQPGWSGPRANPVAQSGFSLIEVLVAALVLSIGLVGVAALQALSLQNNQSAFMRSQATALAYDLADRARANLASANSNLYNPATAGIKANCKTTVGCSPQDLAQHDLAEWNAAVATALPMGTGFICLDSTPDDGTGVGDPQCDGSGNQASVKIWWDDNRDGVINLTATESERLAITFRL